MDSEGEMSILAPKGAHLKEGFVGSHFANYGSFLVLSHEKGGAMAASDVRFEGRNHPQGILLKYTS